MTSLGVVLEAEPPSDKPGPFHFALYGPGGKLATHAGQHRGRTFTVRLDAAIDEAKTPLYVVEWRYGGSKPQRRSLHFLAPLLETIVVAPREFLAGTSSVARVVVKDRAAGTPVAGAVIHAALRTGEDEREVFSGRTDRTGGAVIELAFDGAAVGDHRLLVRVAYRGQRDEIDEPVRVRSAAKTLLTTDKPLYQPGQTIHMRALTLLEPLKRPATGTAITFEVEDAKGNKVFKSPRTTDDFGTASADFVLADELNEGAYTVRAIVAGERREKTVTVERYVLPKFRIDFSTERPFYQPGEQVRGELQVDYFFGKPVAGAGVEIDASKFDVAFESFQRIQGQTDERGHFSWSLTLPQHFVGQPLLDGKAFAKFDVRVTDAADHKEEIARNVTVTSSPLLVAAVPESGRLVPGLRNRVYVVTTYADGTPAATTIEWRFGKAGEWSRTDSDAAGFAELTVDASQSTPPDLALRVADARGHSAERTISLESDAVTGEDRVLLQLDQALYSVGDVIRARARTTRPGGTVYFDLIKNGQVYRTSAEELAFGEARFEFAADAASAGTLMLSAYLIGRDGEIVRDQRLLVVEPANELSVRLRPARASYRPGHEASIEIETTDDRGRAVAAALVLSIVDEAVYALQEMQPGLEKIFFYLERELAKPRYEIHGWELGEIVRPGGEPEAGPDHRDKAARVLLASAEGADRTVGIAVNTFVRDDKAGEYQRIAGKALADNYRAIAEAMRRYAEKLAKQSRQLESGYTLDELVATGLLAREELRDPWGGALSMTDGQWCSSCRNYHWFVLESNGPDRVAGTADDVRYGGDVDNKGRRLRDRGVMVAAEGAVLERAMAMAPGAILDEANAAPAETGAAKPRVRRYFPETLFWQPALITDADGRARLSVPLADSITTWRMTALANSREGLLGSATGPLRVFQDFFVDIDFPLALTQNDRVWVPVAIYNYLQQPQTVRLVVEPGAWFELDGPAEASLTIAADEVRGFKFPIRVRRIGHHRFTVKAYGGAMSDAVERSVEVLPDGEKHLVAVNGRLEGTQEARFEIPAGAIAGASRAYLKVYPGVLSQISEGLDEILRMPFGCFEQTSSATYPNILVLDYVKTTGGVSPELQMKAEGFINVGYQRLLSFEVDGGGFEWFGNAPAHKILTAYGLMEFHDMSQVFTVDPAVISRTQGWLVGQQEKDGSWRPSAGGIREGAIDRFTDDLLRNTAYITLALVTSGYQGEALAKAEAYLVEHLDEIEDTYTLALAANTFAALGGDRPALGRLIEKLLARRIEQDDIVYWKADSETPTHGRGNVADIEVTGWAVMALVRAQQSPAIVSRAISYLVGQKDAFGTWQSTQATIVALKAMLMAEKQGSQPVEATIVVNVNGKQAARVSVTPQNSDVLQQVDLTPYLQDAFNVCRLDVQGEGGLFYQISASYWTPRPDQIRHRDEPLKIAVDYDRKELAANDTLHATVRVSNETPAGMKMVLVDIGVPPGFTVLADRLEQLVVDDVIEKFTLTGRQIIVYIDELSAQQTIAIDYDLLARFPVEAKTPLASAYQYYDPDVRADAPVSTLTILT
ncbi:MAG: hypothetical protein JSV80_11410 [Acidobacteriota bacterium]|nr:MAG: hypothetical protein JSV80_11410 [Acidobacteriota bacterium]